MTDSSGKAKYLHEIEGMYTHNGVIYLKSAIPLHHLQAIRDMEIKNDDVLVATFPKSGTTWTQEIVYLIHNGIDIEEAAARPLYERVPFLDLIKLWPLVNKKTPLPRILKTHLQPSLLPRHISSDKTKIVFMMRNPKDTLVSLYHFYCTGKMFGPFPGSWSDFFELVKANQLVYGDWFDHTLGWWALRDRPNVLCLKYEDMKRNPVSEIRKIVEFVQKDLTDEQIEKIAEATSFTNMKENKSIQCMSKHMFVEDGKTAFVRKGLVGEWKNYFTVAQNEYFDQMYKEKLAGTGLDFDF